MRELGIVADSKSGGTHTSRTMMLRELRRLLAVCPPDATNDDFAQAILTANVLVKRSESTRMRSLRYLRELYVLDCRSFLFRGLRDLWDADVAARPLLAMLCSLARDPLLRSTAETVLDTQEGSMVNAEMLAAAVADQFPNAYGDAVRNKVGRNAASSWTQSGHLEGRNIPKEVYPGLTIYPIGYIMLP